MWRTFARREKRARGFTLVELLLVLAILVVLTGIAVPRLNKSVRGKQLEEAADEMALVIRLARAESVHRKLKVRFTFDEEEQAYWLSVQNPEHSFREQFVPFGDSFLHERRCLPKGVRMGSFAARGAEVEFKDLIFSPDGVGEVCELRLVGAGNRCAMITIGAWFDEVQVTIEEDAPVGDDTP